MPQDAETQARIDAVSWYHDFDFGNGLKAVSTTPDAKTHRATWRFIETELNKVDFVGKSVLDIGCWDGYWSFLAERRGASSVLATDDFTQNWAGMKGLELAKELYGSSIEIRPRQSVYELDRLDRKFDVILCLGVYYHLHDPYYAFSQIRHCCHANTVIVFEGNAAIGLPDAACYFDTAHKTSKFTPAVGALRRMLRCAYLEPQAVEMMAASGRAGRLGWRWRLQTCAQALLGSRSGVGRLVADMTCIDRVVLHCRPIEGVNEAHVYRPPFGLHAYDSRFRDAEVPKLAAAG